MSRSDFAESNQAFADLVAGTGLAAELADIYVPPSAMHTVRIGGDPINLDPFTGADLKDCLVKTASDAEIFLAVGTNTDAEKPDTAGYITTVLAEAIALHRDGVAGSARMAIKGQNIYLCPDEAQEDVPKGTKIYHGEPLGEDEILVGTIFAVNYGRHQRLTKAAIRKSLETGEAPATKVHKSGLIELHNVSICDRDDFGHVDRTYPNAYVPVHKKMFQWFLEAQ